MLIEPKLLKGTRDFGPEEMAKRSTVLETLLTVFRRFGFQQIETPALEYAETLLGKYGDDAAKLVYQFKDHGGRDIALRYDLTVPSARYVAMNLHDLPKPFKRFQVAPVWRAERPQKGRYREFWQCDIDIFGVTNMVADAECAKLASEVFEALKIPVRILINNRRFLNSVLEKIGVADKDFLAVIRTIDKLDKIGKEGVREELMKRLSAKQTDSLLKVIGVEGSNDEKLDLLSGYDVSELREFFDLCEQLGVRDVEFLPSLARGLDYYTGTIYEVVCKGIQLGSICGGGRYDNLCGMFSETSVPGVGWSVGLDRTIVAMEELGLFEVEMPPVKVLVTQFDVGTRAMSLSVVSVLWESGIRAELYSGDDLSLKKQFQYANKKRIPFVLVLGPDEVKKGVVQVKTMQSGEQKEVALEKITEFFLVQP